jgi:crotonobetainyl-CoA:carnitine CoA-transferase CaiB-like acyl-CoA transferase
MLGQHTAQVLGQLGFDAAQIEAMAQAGTVKLG